MALPGHPERTPVRPRRILTPAQTIVLAFLAAIGVGALLLSLPAAHAQGASVSPLDALFTATSAVCVTGLAVVDTGGAFSRLGQTIILLLIKAGGLGILSLGALLALATGRRVDFRERLVLQAQSGRLHVGGVVRFVRNLLLFTTAIELTGAALLYVRFRESYPAGEAAFQALFHSVSAFNNAGFALHPDSLMRYATDPLVSLVIAALIITGGLGVAVVFELTRRLATRRPRGRVALGLHTRVALTMTGLLILTATAFILVAEWGNPGTLGPLTAPQKLLAAFFQAVTPRTAGFNSLEFTEMQRGTLIFVMLLMFVGANPGSTGGGIKTTTAAVLLVALWAVARGHNRPALFRRHIDAALITRAAVITTMALLVIGLVVTTLSFTEPQLGELQLVFETFSAFATVGLSLGATPELSPAGRLLITSVMFLGRVGLITFALAVAKRRQDVSIRYPSEELIVG
jgi:trk system potassium uptake protein TrkH